MNYEWQKKSDFGFHGNRQIQGHKHHLNNLHFKYQVCQMKFSHLNTFLQFRLLFHEPHWSIFSYDSIECDHNVVQVRDKTAKNGREIERKNRVERKCEVFDDFVDDVAISNKDTEAARENSERFARALDTLSLEANPIISV